MRSIVLYIAMSLDGYIADKNGEVDWLDGDNSDKSEEDGYSKFIETVDTIILGYQTYHQIKTDLSPNDWVYHGKTSYVFTHRKEISTDEIVFVNENIVDFLSDLKVQKGKNIWVCGGASIVNQLIDANLIDRYYITVIPIILGDGIRLFGKQDTEKKLHLISATHYNGMVDLVYKVRK